MEHDSPLLYQSSAIDTRERRFFRKEFENKCKLGNPAADRGLKYIRNPILSQLGVFTNSSKKNVSKL
jgi:hypothetical protein